MQAMSSVEGLGKFGDNLSANHWNQLNLQLFTFCIDLAATEQELSITWEGTPIFMTTDKHCWREQSTAVRYETQNFYSALD